MCRMPPSLVTSLVISGRLNESDLGVLNDLVQTVVEQHLVRMCELLSVGMLASNLHSTFS